MVAEYGVFMYLCICVIFFSPSYGYYLICSVDQTSKQTTVLFIEGCKRFERPIEKKSGVNIIGVRD
jgi:hypothetical protein